MGGRGVMVFGCEWGCEGEAEGICVIYGILFEICECTLMRTGARMRRKGSADRGVLRELRMPWPECGARRWLFAKR